MLLDLLRKSLCINTPSLEKTHQEKICTLSKARLRYPWVFDDVGNLKPAGIAWPRSKFGRSGEHLFVSPQSGYGQYLRREIGAHFDEKITLDDASQIIRDLLNCMSQFGLVEKVRKPVKYRVQIALVIKYQLRFLSGLKEMEFLLETH